MDTVLAYQDDVIIFGATREEYNLRVKSVLSRTSSSMQTKSSLASPSWVQNQYDRLSAGLKTLVGMESPRIQSHLRFIPNLATRTQMLFSVQLSDEWQWTDECQRTLHRSMKFIAHRPILAPLVPKNLLCW